MVFTGCIASRVIENKWIAQKISDSTLVDRLHVDSNIVIENTYLHGLFKEGLLIDRYNKTSLRFLDTTLSKASRLTYFVDYKIDSLRIYFWIPMSRNSYPYTLYYVVNDKIIDSFKTRNNPIWIRRHPIRIRLKYPRVLHCVVVIMYWDKRAMFYSSIQLCCLHKISE